MLKLIRILILPIFILIGSYSCKKNTCEYLNDKLSLLTSNTWLYKEANASKTFEIQFHADYAYRRIWSNHYLVNGYGSGNGYDTIHSIRPDIAYGKYSIEDCKRQIKFLNKDTTNIYFNNGTSVLSVSPPSNWNVQELSSSLLNVITEPYTDGQISVTSKTMLFKKK